jgi:hypothetical protein
MEPNFQVEPTLISIAQAVSRVETSQKDFRRELLGNGQKGRVQILEDNVEDHKKSLDGMNRRYWIFTGIILGFLFVTHGGKEILEYLLKIL